MLKHVPRISFVFFANAVLNYILFFLLIILATPHPWEGGLLMFSPAGLAIFFLILPSLAAGFCNGFLINSIPIKFIQKTKFIFILGFAGGLIVALCWCGFISFTENINYIFSPLFFILLSVFSISNIFTMFSAKRIFLNNNSTQNNFAGKQENASA
jgi:hypothetical protein